MALVKRDLMKTSSPAKFRRFNRGSPRVSHGLRTPSGARTCVRNLGKAMSEANVKVVVRVRPLNKKEQMSNARTIVKIVDEKMLIFDPQEEEESSFFYRGIQQKGRDMLKRQHKHTQFLFDRVFGFDSTNQQVFGESTMDIITSVLDGYNCSVFVYGATGAGKTFTMLGSEDNPGVMFLTMVTLFERMEQLKVDRDFEMGVSYLEVYNETVNDLITGSSPLYLREDTNGVFVSGLKIERIHDTARLFELLAEGNKHRTQHPTDANAESSRSHAVFQVYLKMTAKGSNQTKMVKLSMIDLAGSERGSATNYAGARFKEGSSINKSLLALGNCINKLADGLPHIPYRDSKLTRILKDSLGGNCRTVMIANISPSQSTFEDTLNTLRYAKRAKMIKSTVKKNIVSVEMHVSHYIKMVDDLKEENARLKAELAKAEAALEASKCSNAANPVYTTPVKAIPAPPAVEKDDLMLQSLFEEVRKLFSEKQELQRRYLQMDSKEKVLKWRMECKQRSVARVEQLSDTPTNAQEAMFRATRSLKQFCGQLESAMDCQEGLADKRKELDEQLKSLRDRATALGVDQEFSEKVEKMDLEFQNAQLMEQQAHLQKVITLVSKEKEDQDQVMTELSSAFRRYYNLLRGHGHMTDTMLREHKSLVRRFEGLKTVNWQEAEENESSKDPPPLNSISKLSLSDSLLAGGRFEPPSPAPPVENIKPSSTDILKSSDGDTEVCDSLEPYKRGSFDIERIKRDIDKISSMVLPTPTTTMVLPTPTTTMALTTPTTTMALTSPTTTMALTAPTTMEETVKPCALNDLVDDDEFCIRGKFAYFNATFERINEDMDATINKVDSLLNESYTVQARPLNVTFDAESQELNKTYDKRDLLATEVSGNVEVNPAGRALNLTFINDDDKENKVEEAVGSETAVSVTSLGARQERTSLDTTYQLVSENSCVEDKVEASPVVRSHVSPSFPCRISPVARKSPRTSPVARKSPRMSPATRKSPYISPATRKSPHISPATRKSPHISPATRKSPSSSTVLNQAPKVSEKADLDSTFEIQPESSVGSNANALPGFRTKSALSSQAWTKGVLSLATPQQGHKFVKPSFVPYVRTNVPSARRPKVVLSMKKPLQESNSLRRERTPVKVAAESTKSTALDRMKGPLAADAAYTSLERKFPLNPKLNPRLKSETLLGNKENGVRKC